MNDLAVDAAAENVEAWSGKNRGDENFPVGSLLIARHLRPHMHAYYSFARNADDIADSGELVPAEKILQAAVTEQADIIGLSGLITPSLDEMCHVAAEMERQGFEVPLLIGGATTSRVHTAVKIHPHYRRGQAVYVTDASRAVGVVGAHIDALRIAH